jgi:ubiquilin
MMNSPEFLQQMSSLMSNPAVLEQALALNPQYAAMGPQAREIFQSERFRQMMFVPCLHFGLPFCAKISCRSNPETLRGMIQMASMMRGAGLDPQASPFEGSTPIAPGNPNATSALNPTSTTTPPVGGPAPGGTPPTPNLFGGDPGALLQLLGGVPPSADAHPPEERFQVQLQVRHFVMSCALELTCIHFHSNYKTWALPMPRRMCAPFLRQAGTCIRR